MAWTDKLADFLRLNDGEQAYVGYPQMQVGLTKPRQAGYATGFLEGATGADSMQPKNPITDPNYDQYAQGKNIGEAVNIGAMAVPAYAMALRAGAPKAYNALENYMVKSGGMIPLEAYHGTPHTIEGAFSAAKGGTGQGTQNFGHGTYFAESPEIAKGYINAGKPANTRAKTFLELHDNDIDKALQMANQSLEATNQISPANRAGAIKSAKDLINELEVIKDPKSLSLLDKLKGKTQGNLYKVDIPDEKIPNMLNWYEDVPEDLRKRLSEKAMEQFGSGISPSTGERLYKEIAFSLKQAGSQNPQADASKWLADHGVTGVKYENFQIKKGQGAGTHNYVVFDPSNVQILEKNGVPTRKELIQQQIDKIE